jgi:hypothetical protein
MYISDVMMEETVLEGAATPEVLLEGFVKGSFDKIKRMFEALWAKVKSWFEAAKKTLQRIFLSGEAFIKKFKEEIRSASKKGFTYEGFKYTLDAGHGKVTAKLKTLNDEIAAAVGFDISHVTQDSQSSSISGDSGKHKESFDLSEEKEKLLKALGNEELSEVLKEVGLAFRNGQDGKEEFEDFSGGNSKEELIKMVEEAGKHVKDIETAQKNIDGQFQRVLAAINKAKSKIEGEKTTDEAGAQSKGKAVTYATHKYNMAHYALSLMTSLVGVEVEAIKEAAKKSESVLKSFLSFKPAKEGWSVDTNEDQTEGDSILESAMKYI